MYGRRGMRRYRKSNTQRKGRRFFRSYGKAYNSYNSRNRYNNKYRRTKVRLPTRIMPDYTLVKLKDTRIISLDFGNNPTDGTYSVSNTYISGSDIYNAWQIPVGEQPTQPTGFDQWAGFYGNFIVHKSSVRVTPLYWTVNTIGGGQQTQAFQLTVTPVDATNLSTFSTSFDEQPYSRFKMYNGLLQSVTSAGVLNVPQNTGTQNFQSVINSMMTKKILGYKDLSDVPDVQGLMEVTPTVVAANSPGTQFYWNIEAKSLVLAPAGSTTSNYILPSLSLKVDIYYKVQLLNRRSILDSGNDQEA